jgi:hypothetical protein
LRLREWKARMERQESNAVCRLGSQQYHFAPQETPGDEGGS